MDKMYSSHEYDSEGGGGELQAIAADLREALEDGDDAAVAAALEQAITCCLEDQGFTVTISKG